MALEERVDRVGGAAALGHRLDDGRGADPHVARAEYAGRPVVKVTASAGQAPVRWPSTPSEPWLEPGRGRGPWPMASRTRSQSMVNSVPGTGSGRRRPDASGAPSFMPAELDAR